jgi:HEAT repeat protein
MKLRAVRPALLYMGVLILQLRRSVTRIRSMLRRYPTPVSLVLLLIGAAACHRPVLENEVDVAALVPRLSAATSPENQLAVLDALSTVEPAALDGDTPDPAKAVVPLLSTADPAIDAKAGDLLSNWGDHAATPGLVRLLGNADAMIRVSAATSLGTLADPSAADALVRATQDVDGNVRAAACRALGALRQHATAPAVRARLTDDDAAVRAAAAEAIGTTGSTEDVPLLLAALADPTMGVVSAAARGLGSLGDRRAVAPLIALLANAPQPVRCAAATALGSIAGRSAVGPLARMLADKDLAQRIAVLNALRSLADPAAIPAVIDVAADGNPFLAKRLPYILARLHDPTRPEDLTVYLSSPSPDVRAAVGAALGLAGERHALPLLKSALADPVARARKGTVEGIALLCVGDCRQLLGPVATGDVDPEVREAADIGLALAVTSEMGVVQRLEEGLNRPEEWVRFNAVERLGLLGATQSTAAVRRLALRDADPLVRLEARLALLRMTDPDV